LPCHVTLLLLMPRFDVAATTPARGAMLLPSAIAIATATASARRADVSGEYTSYAALPL